MFKFYCDTCGEEREEKDKREISVTKPDGSPAMKKKDSCVFCVQKVEMFIETLSKS